MARISPKERINRSIFNDDALFASLVAKAPAELDVLTKLRAAMKAAVKTDQWFVVCCLASVIGELVFAALDTSGADKLPKLDALRRPAQKAKSKHKEGKLTRYEYYLPIAALRHTCFHPAMENPIKDLPPEHFPNMAALYERDAADWALENLDLAMRHEAA